jgi:hypothetical protein
MTTERAAWREAAGCTRESDGAAPPGAGSDWNGTERRKHPRIRAALSGKLVDGDDRQNIRIANVSLGGAMIRGEREIAANGTLQLEIMGTSVLHVQRIWQNGPVVRLMFLEPPHEVVAAMTKVAPVFGNLLQAS